MAEFERARLGGGAPSTGLAREARPLSEGICGLCCWMKINR